MNEKIYVVTWGDYSDYSIMGIFNSFDLAVKLIKDSKDNYDFESMCIEEHVINDRPQRSTSKHTVDDLKQEGYLDETN